MICLLQEDKLLLIFLIEADEVPGGDATFPTKETQRGGAEQKDMYYFTGLNISFRPSFGGWWKQPQSRDLAKKENMVAQLFHCNS